MKLTESQLKTIIKESALRVLKEMDEVRIDNYKNMPDEEFVVMGVKSDSNWGGIEVQIDSYGDAARFRDNHGAAGEPTDWLPIEYDENGDAYVRTQWGVEELKDYMRV